MPAIEHDGRLSFVRLVHRLRTLGLGLGRAAGVQRAVATARAGLAVGAARVERLCMAAPDAPQRWTLSQGVADLAADTTDLNAWMREADKALYLAKARGRNCVCLPAAAPPTLAAAAG